MNNIAADVAAISVITPPNAVCGRIPLAGFYELMCAQDISFFTYIFRFLHIKVMLC